MKRFRYGADALCIAACVAYALNRWCVPDDLKGGFLAGHFNDLLLIPAALPWVLFAQRVLGLRRHDRPPTGEEVGMHVAIWGVIAEWVAPHVVKHAVADWRDLVAYAIGAACALGWWSWREVAATAWKSAVADSQGTKGND